MKVWFMQPMCQTERKKQDPRRQRGKPFLALIVATVVLFSVIFSVPVSIYGASIESACDWAVAIANDDRYGYSQQNRYGNPDYDCSSLVCAAFAQAGFGVSRTGWTGSMIADFQQHGFRYITDIDLSTSANLKRGDILWKTGHTELYIGDGKLCGAHMDYDGRGGDSGGNEISVTNYHGGWEGVLRYDDGNSQTLTVSFSSWQNDAFTYIGTTDASIGQEIVVSGGSCTETGMYLYDAAGNHIGTGKNSFYTDAKVYFKINEECGCTLTPGTTYYYQFYAVVDGITHTSVRSAFTTAVVTDRLFGIDVSHHQGTIDWQTVSEHIDFAIIRCGYASDTTKYDDREWSNNVAACERYGIPYGVYLYSYAENVAEAESEAAHVLRLLSGHKPSLPIYYDLEDDKTVGKLSDAQIGALYKAFSQKLKEAGYAVGVYASWNWWNNKLSSVWNETDHRWLAYWTTSYTADANQYELWQYSSTGRIPGINGNVDLDYCLAPDLVGGHKHSAETIPGKAAACTESGLTDGARCSVCGEILKAQQEIPALGHDWADDFTIDHPATEKEAGEKSIHCKRCDARKDITELPKLDDCMIGDTNGDSRIDAKDILRLCSYLQEFDYDTNISPVSIDMKAADCNGDGKIDSKDILRLCSYLQEFDYDAGSSPVKLGE